MNFSSNDYLGLANAAELKRTAALAVSQWGVGAGASHLVCGHQTPHERLELDIAALVGAERALLFSTGYMANLGVINALVSKGDLLLQDKLNHASLLDAGMLSQAQNVRYAHCDITHAERRLQRARNKNQRVMMASDTVFSMDGDIAPVPQLKQLADQVGAMLVLDDAHGFGVMGDRGAGTLSAQELRPEGNVLMVGTLGKAVGGFGAFVAGDQAVIEHIEQFARSYVYTTALPAYTAEVNRAALEILSHSHSRLRTQLKANIAQFRALAQERSLPLCGSETAIQPVIIGCEKDALKISQQLERQGYLVVAIRPPTVPPGTARLRVSLSATHTEQQIAGLVESLAVACKEVRYGR
jgi:8-amino-7-oxononanoate synthase